MKFLICLFLTGCKTIYPQISCTSFEACQKLCQKKGGVHSMQVAVHIDYTLGIQIAGETCICKNRTATMMAPLREVPKFN